MSQVLVDIIFPNYNKAEHLDESITSVINQSLKQWNLIVVDDNSTDNSKEILEKYKSIENIKIIHLRKNKGVSFSRNLAIRFSKAKYVSFLDSDDIWTPNKLNDQINFMEKNNYNFTYTNYMPFLFNKDKKIFKKTVVPKKSYSYNEIILDTSIGTSTMVIRKSLIGLSKFPKISSFEDYPFKYKILKKDKAHFFPSTSTFYRISSNSLSSNKIKNLLQLFKVNRKFNKLKLFNNLKSILFISISSIKKYGFK